MWACNQHLKGWIWPSPRLLTASTCWRGGGFAALRRHKGGGRGQGGSFGVFSLPPWLGFWCTALAALRPVCKRGIASLCSEWARERGGNFNKKFKSICNSQILMFYVFMGYGSVNGGSYDALFFFRETIVFIWYCGWEKVIVNNNSLILLDSI